MSGQEWQVAIGRGKDRSKGKLPTPKRDARDPVVSHNPPPPIVHMYRDTPRYVAPPSNAPFGEHPLELPPRYPSLILVEGVVGDGPRGMYPVHCGASRCTMVPPMRVGGVAQIQGGLQFNKKGSWGLTTLYSPILEGTESSSGLGLPRLHAFKGFG